MSADIQVRGYADGDEDAVLDLLGASLGEGPTGERSAAYFRWKHLDNPFGRSHALVAEADGEVVGFRTFMRWTFTDGRRAVPAVRAVDTATHPDHQGRGIFTRLTLAALEDLAGSAALVFNTPNGQSLPGYLKMGWAPVGVVPLHLRVRRPLRVLAAARSIPRGGAGGTPTSDLPSVASLLDHEEEAVADLLAASAPTDRLRTQRSVAYLRWRYVDPPGLDYRAVGLCHRGRLAGVAIVRPRFRGTLSELTVCEVLVGRAGAGLTAHLLRAVARAAGDHATLHAGSGTVTRKDALRAGFVPVPRQGVMLVARPLRPVHPDPTRLNSWALSIGDLELF